MEASGNVDYSDTQNLKATANVSVTKDFNADVRKNDSVIYFKINKFPDYLFTYLNIDKAKITPLFDNWIAYDTKTLDTQARQELNKKNDQRSLTQQYISNLVDDLVDDKLLPELKVSDESLDGNATYKIHLSADDKTVDNLVYKIENKLQNGAKKAELKVNSTNTKPSDYIKNFSLDIWIDKGNYLVRKVVNSLDYQPSPTGNAIPTQVLGISQTPISQLTQLPFSSAVLSSTKTSVATVVKFDHFGEAFTIEIPSSSLKPEDFYKKFMEASGFAQQASAAAALKQKSSTKAPISSSSSTLR